MTEDRNDRPGLRSWVAALGPASLLLLASADALARVGGGEGYNGGGGHSGGGGSGGGGGGGDGIGDLIYLLIWLCIKYPAVGIPLVILLGIGFLLHLWFGSAGRRKRRRFDPDTGMPAVGFPPPRRVGVDFAAIRAVDPKFSLPVLLDFVQLLHRRSAEAAPKADWEPLVPFLGELARRQLQGLHDGVAKVSDVVTAAITPGEAGVAGQQKVSFRIENARRETMKDGSERRVVLTELWTFERALGAVSLPPDAIRRMGCPSCGAAVKTDPQGRCSNCGTPITDGRMQWVCTSVSVDKLRRPIQAPSYAPAPGGVEPGYHASTVVAPDLAVRMRGFIGRHPEFDAKAFRGTVSDAFLTLQKAWGAGRWEEARPFCTDPMFDTLRFWIDRYNEAGLKNRIDDPIVERVEIVNVEPDAWYEAVTVRIWANAKDYVADGAGKVVGGNASTPRAFSEYWTFLRTAGGSAAVKDSKHCPSCGAPLDKVNAAGICGYCDTRITTGEFTWVLSRIAQPEAYQG